MVFECVLVLTELRLQFLQVIDEYDEQSEVAERLRIKVNA